MARVLALVADLLFGSRVQSALETAGHEVELVPDAARLRDKLAEARTQAGAVLIVDLTDAQLEGARVLDELAREGVLAGMRTLGFYAHVDVRTRERAERAGFDLLVPRSRMAREAAELVERLSSEP
jgi:DNA-binding NarL/FixJ family response regulator